MSKSERQEAIAKGIYLAPQPNNVIQKLAYLYSKGAEEDFFSNPKLNELFLKLLPLIRAARYIPRAGSALSEEEAQLEYAHEVDILHVTALIYKAEMKKEAEDQKIYLRMSF